MDSPTDTSSEIPAFYIGQHESKRSHQVTRQVLHQAHDCNFDLVTAPITTAHFHSRVLTLLSSYLAELEGGALPESVPKPLISPLTPADTPLTPTDITSSLLTLTSPWIDLASPDPIITDISRQVLNLEIAYAAFCGVQIVIVQGPKLHHGSLHAEGIARYARAIQEALAVGPYLQFYIHLPMVDHPDMDLEEDVGHLAPFARGRYLQDVEIYKKRKADFLGTWDVWNIIRSVCKYHPRLFVALTMPRHLPTIPTQDRWYSEPLRLLNIPATAFLRNASGYPVLSKPQQALVSRYMRLRTLPWLLLSDVGPIPGLNDPDLILPMETGFLSPGHAADAPQDMSASPTPAEAAHQQEQRRTSKERNLESTDYLRYIRHLQQNQPPKSTIERFGAGYQDYLQTPLQPLTDNLESVTYEVFEKDPIKYDWYERAIAQALRDWSSQCKPTSSSSGAVVVAVVGAGRGPLVTRALRASQDTGIEIEMWAVEKNPNAYVLLQRHNLEDWNQRVTVVKSDMRSWKGPLLQDGTHGRVDIVVSELLGSFADNELSPECLDGVQHVLNPYCGISIPKSYTAHLTPLAAPKLHAEIQTRTATDPTAPETPYVVMLHQISYLSTVPLPQSSAQSTANGTDATANAARKKHEDSPAQPDVQTCWAFRHPIPDRILAQSNLRRGGGASGGGGGATGGDGANEHNTRYCKLKFQCKDRGVCHGLGGYFETVLYEGSEGVEGDGTRVELSTNPNTMEAKSSDMISWFPLFFPLKVPLYLPDHSELQVSMWRQTDDRKVWYEWFVEAFAVVGDKKIRLGASELHSSKKNGCLM